MATAANNAEILIENGRTLVDFHQLTDSGDRKLYTSASAQAPFSRVAGFAPEIRPNGIITGGAVTAAASATNNAVDVAALTCYLAGVKVTVAVDTDVAITRAATDTHKISSITVDSTGALAVVAGVESTAFSEARGANGGPPFIPVGSIELAQVRLSSQTAAPVTPDEIYAIVGQHRELYNYPTFSVNSLSGEISFASAMAATHTGGAAKQIYAKFYEISFQKIDNADGFKPIEKTLSSGSQATYDGAIGSVTPGIGSGGFTVYAIDGHSNILFDNRDKEVCFKFFADRDETNYALTQGKLAFTTTYPSTGTISITATILPTSAGPTVNVIA